MQTLGDPREHFWRVIKMAKANAVDLSTALDEGAIDIDDYVGMIERCRGCADVGRCDRDLAGLPQLEEAPDYCVNKTAFAGLKRATR